MLRPLVWWIRRQTSLSVWQLLLPGLQRRTTCLLLVLLWLVNLLLRLLPLLLMRLRCTKRALSTLTLWHHIADDCGQGGTKVQYQLGFSGGGSKQRYHKSPTYPYVRSVAVDKGVACLFHVG